MKVKVKPYSKTIGECQSGDVRPFNKSENSKLCIITLPDGSEILDKTVTLTKMAQVVHFMYYWNLRLFSWISQLFTHILLLKCGIYGYKWSLHLLSWLLWQCSLLIRIVNRMYTVSNKSVVFTW